MRAYLRLDPNFADRKADYSDGAHRAYIDCLCFAEQQPQRGRFRNARLLAVLLEKRAKWIPYLIEHGDLVKLDRGVLYVDGWDEWQEGDWKVAERVARIRNRKTVTSTVTPTVTPTVSPDVSNLQGGKAVGGKPLLAEAGGRNNGLPNGNAMGFRPKASVEDVHRQHDESWSKCVECGVTGRKHPASGDHAFKPEKLRAVK